MKTLDNKYPTMTKKHHRAYCKKLARFLATHIEFQMNLIGLEAALLVNFGLTVTNQTLLVIYDDYKKVLTSK
jgi:hypothetical protein